MRPIAPEPHAHSRAFAAPALQILALSILLHMATGLEYLHGLNLIHGGAPPPGRGCCVLLLCGPRALRQIARLTCVLHPQT